MSKCESCKYYSTPYPQYYSLRCSSCIYYNPKKDHYEPINGKDNETVPKPENKEEKE